MLPPRASTALAAASLLLIAGCGGQPEPAAVGATPSAEPSVSPSPASAVEVPSGVELSEVGADLSFGDTATVIHEPNQNRGSVLELTVQGARQGTMKDFAAFVLDDYTRESTPYYVDVEVRNVGEADVGGAPVPLWGVDGRDTLLPAATFTTAFRTCPSKPLPARFGPDDTFATCLVYLAPDAGTLEAVSFRPNQEFPPIQWTGDVASPEPAKRQRSPQESPRG